MHQLLEELSQYLLDVCDGEDATEDAECMRRLSTWARFGQEASEPELSADELLRVESLLDYLESNEGRSGHTEISSDQLLAARWALSRA